MRTPSILWLVSCTTLAMACTQDWESSNDVDASADTSVSPPLMPSTPDAAVPDAASEITILDASPDATETGPKVISPEASIPEVKCGTSSCANGGTCAVVDGQTQCSCPATWKGSDCREDVDECKGTNSCNPHFPCQNFPGGYSCLGQTADWRIPERTSSGGTPAQQGWIIDATAGTALDEITGLMWQRAASSKTFASCAEARDYCIAERTGNFSDWRVPSLIELSTLWATQTTPDYALWHPNPAALPQTVWTNTFHPNGSTCSATFNSPYRYGIPDKGANPGLNALCVRTAQIMVSGTPEQRYQVNTELDVTYDKRTQLTWARAVEPKVVAYWEAEAYCAKLGPKYRLPTMVELLSLWDLGPMKLTDTVKWQPYNENVVQVFWSSTRHSVLTTSHVYVSANYSWYFYWYWGGAGDGSRDPANQLLPEWYVRCVKSGPP